MKRNNLSMVNAKTDFKQSGYIEHPFGTSKPGLLCESLNNLFRDRQEDQISRWLDDNIKTESPPQDTPIMTLLLCASYAAIGKKDTATALFGFCFKKKSTVFQNFEDGNHKIQNKTKQKIIELIGRHLNISHKQLVDLLACALFQGNDPYIITEIVKRTKGTALQDYGFSIARAAHDTFPPDSYISQAIIHLCHPENEIKWLERAWEKFPHDPFYLSQLAHAYLKNDRAGHSVQLLCKHAPKFPDDDILKTMLGVSAAQAGMKKIFDTMKHCIKPASSRDYFEARFLYLEGKTLQAKTLLDHHVLDKTQTCNTKTLGLYLACIGDQASIYNTLAKVRSEYNYETLLQIRDEWRESPLRFEMDDLNFSNGNMLYETGGSPINKQAGDMAGALRPPSYRR